MSYRSIFTNNTVFTLEVLSSTLLVFTAVSFQHVREQYYTQGQNEACAKLLSIQGICHETKGIRRLPYIAFRAMRALVVQGDI